MSAQWQQFENSYEENVKRMFHLQTVRTFSAEPFRNALLFINLGATECVSVVSHDYTGGILRSHVSSFTGRVLQSQPYELFSTTILQSIPTVVLCPYSQDLLFKVNLNTYGKNKCSFMTNITASVCPISSNIQQKLKFHIVFLYWWWFCTIELKKSFTLSTYYLYFFVHYTNN